MRRQAPPRQIGFWTASRWSSATIIGSGIFLLPAALAPLGWNALYGWVITIGGALCLAYVLRAAGAADAGGGRIRTTTSSRPSVRRPASSSCGATGSRNWVDAMRRSRIAADQLSVARSPRSSSAGRAVVPLCAIGMVDPDDRDQRHRGVRASGGFQIVDDASSRSAAARGDLSLRWSCSASGGSSCEPLRTPMPIGVAAIAGSGGADAFGRCTGFECAARPGRQGQRSRHGRLPRATIDRHAVRRPDLHAA